MEIIRRRNGMQHARVRGAEEHLSRAEAQQEAARLEYIRQTETVARRRDALDHERRRLIGTFAERWADHASALRAKAEATPADATTVERWVRNDGMGRMEEFPRILFTRDVLLRKAAQMQAQADALSAQSNNLMRSGTELEQVVAALVEPPTLGEKEEVAA